MVNMDKLQKLSKFRLSDKEKEKYCAELSETISALSIIDEVDTSKVEITYANVLDISELRQDIIIPSMDREKLLANAPEKTDSAYLVPGVIE